MHDYIKLGIAYLIFVVITIACFFKTTFYAFTTATAIFYIFTLPGFILLHRFKFTERLIFGTIIGMAVVGMFSYYVGLLGFPIHYHLIIPTALIIIGFVKEVIQNGDTSKP